MSSEIRFLGWKAQGLRCPDHEVDFSRSLGGGVYRVSLIQMPNGTGKTTTLSLLRAALSGTAKDWDREKVSEFRKKGTSSQQGQFEVRLLLNQKRATIIMNFDFDLGLVTYKTTYGSGQRNDFSPPSEFKRFLNPDFISFFVFNGELAEHLLDRTYTDAETVVENLFQISTLGILQQRVKEYWLNKTQNVTATEEKGLTRRQNKLQLVQNRLDQLRSAKKRLEETKKELTTLLRQQQAKYDHELRKEDEQSANLSAARDSVKSLEGKVRETALDVLEDMRNPHAVSVVFARSLAEFKKGLDRVKLPESAAREFFEELASEIECICGRHIDDAISKTIRDRASQYLGSEDVTLLNQMKGLIQDAVGQSLDEPETALSAKLIVLSETVQSERLARQELDELHQTAEQADPLIKAAREEIDNLQSRLSEVDRELDKFENGEELGDDKTTDIQIMERKLKKAEEHVAEITTTMTIRAKRDILVSILEDAQVQARQDITRELCSQANSRIRELMPYNNISISGIERSLKLSDQEGGSVGETLSVGYAFLATLFNRSEHKLPFVVDSPAGSIDFDIRSKIGELIPKLTDQFIAFTISSERGRFVQPLKTASGNDTQFITLFRKVVPEYVNEARTMSHCSETDDGMMVQGEGFFNEFQLDSEEAI